MTYFLISVLDDSAKVVTEGYLDVDSPEDAVKMVEFNLNPNLSFKVEKFYYPRHGALDSYTKFNLEEIYKL